MSKRQPPSVVGAEEAARVRVERDIASLGATMRSVIDQRMTADIQREAIIAELKRQGAGLPVVMERVSQMSSSAARSPP
ncbi:hypothetical protein [Agrobacterium sp.]|uniref:hypothetical protein n=1 Tax=Agrobacterium sp. TaxID=361 RepID=UPI0028ACEE37